MTIAPLTKWLYIGEELGFGLVHTVMSVDLDVDPKMPYITCWSDLYQEDTYDGEIDDDPGMTWHGPLNLFIEYFQPLGPDEEADA